MVGVMRASIAAVSLESRSWFWVAGSALGLFIGPVQAASPSFMARLSPHDRQTEFFGLFALSGKATAFVGPAMVAAATDMAGSQRIGLATVIGLFVAGLSLLLTVQDPRPLSESPLRVARADIPRARASVRRLCREK